MAQEHQKADAEEMQERIEELEEGIKEAEKEAQDAGILEDPDEPRFYETGEQSDHDDQTVTPPG